MAPRRNPHNLHNLHTDRAAAPAEQNGTRAGNSQDANNPQTWGPGRIRDIQKGHRVVDTQSASILDDKNAYCMYITTFAR